MAKVFTIIDPRVPLPEAVNVQFDSGDICRIAVSSPWMPPVCSHCKEAGHSVKRCRSAPITCPACKSSAHSTENCPRAKQQNKPEKKQKKAPAQQQYVAKTVTATPLIQQQEAAPASTEKLEKPPDWKGIGIAHATQDSDSDQSSDIEPDSSDVPSSASDREEGEFITVTRKKKTRKGGVKNPTKH